MTSKAHYRPRNPVKTYLARLDEIPPPLCRLIARTGGRHPRLLSMTQIAERAGLTWQKAAAIARQKSFARVTVEDAERFRLGCGITMQSEHHQKEFIMRNIKRDKPYEHLFGMTKPHWPRSWREKFMKRILKNL